jgi:YHS domain-containing protein
MTPFKTALAAAAFAFTSVMASQALAKEAINTQGSDHNVAISGLDTVAFFTEHKPVQGKESFSYEWKGAKWLFASTKDRDLFKSDPETYAPQWGGFCAVGISNGHVSKHLVKGSYDIHDGKLYLFAQGINGDFDQYRKEWLEEHGGAQSRVDTGNKLWPDLQSKWLAAQQQASAVPASH